MHRTDESHMQSWQSSDQEIPRTFKVCFLDVWGLANGATPLVTDTMLPWSPNTAERETIAGCGKRGRKERLGLFNTIPGLGIPLP